MCTPQPRQRLDLYLPEEAGEGAELPVVIFVTGAPWGTSQGRFGSQ